MIDSINELKIESLKLPTSYQLQSSISIVSDNNNNNNNSDSRKSLTCLSKEFIMMFLKGEREIFFDNIAKALIGDVNNAVIKTKVRRLYDIANVLSSIGIICKNPTNKYNTARTFYRWTSHVIVYDADGNYTHKYVGPYPECDINEYDLVKPILPNQPVSLICDEMKDLSQCSNSSELSNQSFSDEDITEDKSELHLKSLMKSCDQRKQDGSNKLLESYKKSFESMKLLLQKQMQEKCQLQEQTTQIIYDIKNKLNESDKQYQKSLQDYANLEKERDNLKNQVHILQSSQQQQENSSKSENTKDENIKQSQITPHVLVTFHSDPIIFSYTESSLCSEIYNDSDKSMSLNPDESNISALSQYESQIEALENENIEKSQRIEELENELSNVKTNTIQHIDILEKSIRSYKQRCELFEQQLAMLNGDSLPDQINNGSSIELLSHVSTLEEENEELKMELHEVKEQLNYLEEVYCNTLSEKDKSFDELLLKYNEEKMKNEKDLGMVMMEIININDDDENENNEEEENDDINDDESIPIIADLSSCLNALKYSNKHLLTIENDIINININEENENDEVNENEEEEENEESPSKSFIHSCLNDIYIQTKQPDFILIENDIINIQNEEENEVNENEENEEENEVENDENDDINDDENTPIIADLSSCLNALKYSNKHLLTIENDIININDYDENENDEEENEEENEESPSKSFIHSCLNDIYIQTKQPDFILIENDIINIQIDEENDEEVNGKDLGVVMMEIININDDDENEVNENEEEEENEESPSKSFIHSCLNDIYKHIELDYIYSEPITIENESPSLSSSDNEGNENNELIIEKLKKRNEILEDAIHQTIEEIKMKEIEQDKGKEIFDRVTMKYKKMIEVIKNRVMKNNENIRNIIKTVKEENNMKKSLKMIDKIEVNIDKIDSLLTNI